MLHILHTVYLDRLVVVSEILGIRTYLDCEIMLLLDIEQIVEISIVGIGNLTYIASLQEIICSDGSLLRE